MVQLRAQKFLERITIKELSKLAGFSKSAFYLYYKDIYDLFKQLQNKIIQNILNCIIQPGIQNLVLIDQVS